MHWPTLVKPNVGEYLPIGHLLHCDSVVAPWAALYFPAAHGVHAEALVAARSLLYLPGEQGVHESRTTVVLIVVFSSLLSPIPVVAVAFAA